MRWCGAFCLVVCWSLIAEARSYKEILYQEGGRGRIAWLGNKGHLVWEAWKEGASWRFVRHVVHEPLLGLSAGREGMIAHSKRCLWRWGKVAWKPRCLVSQGESILDVAWTDLDGDGTQGIVVLIRKVDGDGRLVGVHAKDGRWMRLSIERLRRPWMLESADVDGDGKDELIIGMFRPSYFDRVVRRRLWIYLYLPRRASLFPKWRGSRFSLPWLDAVPLAERMPRLYPSQGTHPWKEAWLRSSGTQAASRKSKRTPQTQPSQKSDVTLGVSKKRRALRRPKRRVFLAVLEQSKHSRQRVMLYRWSSFGFVGEKTAALRERWHGLRYDCGPQGHCLLWSQRKQTQAQRLRILLSLLP